MAIDRPTCYRCDEPVDDVHRIRLSSTHEGEHIGPFRDVDRRICLDCLAAIGMLEFDIESNRSDRSGLSERVMEIIS